MPVELVLVRHGRSEGNEAREQSKQGDTVPTRRSSAEELLAAVARVQRLIPGRPVDLPVDA